MIKITRLRLLITANKSNEQESEKFGFNFTFTNGLNVIKGENSSGKSTTVSCLYFALGMEELLGGKNLKGLDKSLHTEFSYNGYKYKVQSSIVYLTIENSKNEIRRLKRVIKNETKTSYQIIEIEEKEKENLIKFVHREGDNSSSSGFYHWLASFIGIELPNVLSSEGEEKKLYLQTIMPALFIEQTKGWSDFLGSQPYFGIKDNKLRTIEFILGLNSLFNEVEKQKLEAEKDNISKQWAYICNRIKVLCLGTGESVNIPQEPVLESESLENINILVYEGLNKNTNSSLQEYISKKTQEKEILDLTPLPVKGNTEELQLQLQIKQKELTNYKKAEKEFLSTLEQQKQQQEFYTKHLNELEKEISSNKDIKYLIEKTNIISVVDSCPTCNQKVDTNLLDNNSDIELKTIEANIKYLKSQKDLLTASLKNITETLHKKESIKQYFTQDIAKLENEIGYLSTEICDPEQLPSRSKIYESISLNNELNKLNLILDSFDELKGELNNLSEKYLNNSIAFESILNEDEDDSNTLTLFETNFKSLLTEFEYSSNEIDNISIQKKAPFKYFPIVTIKDTDKQKIQISSSASDFIRSQWAYTFSLLKGKNHPGILIIDEPGQHAMKLSSLKKFFSIAANNLSEFQIIVAASTEKKINGLEYTLDEALLGINHNSINLEENFDNIKGKSKAIKRRMNES